MPLAEDMSVIFSMVMTAFTMGQLTDKSEIGQSQLGEQGEEN